MQMVALHNYVVLVLMPDAAKGGPGIFVDGGLPQEVASLLWLDLRLHHHDRFVVTGSTPTFLQWMSPS